MNAAERAIQTFKDAFIAALATTNSDFLLQLWDKITPQVHSTNHMIGTNISLPLWDAKWSSTRMATPEDHGHHEVSTDGTWDHQWISTDVTCTTSPRLGHIESWIPQNFPPTLPNAKHDPTPTILHTHRKVGQIDSNCRCN